MTALPFPASAQAPEPVVVPAEPIPSAFRVSEDEYPVRARRERMQGTARLRILISAEGKVKECTIIGTSGHQILDDQACRIAINRWRFSPATVTGKPEMAIDERNYNWILTATAGSLKPPARPDVIRIHRQENGRITVIEQPLPPEPPETTAHQRPQ